MLTKYGLLSVFRMSETPTLSPPPDDAVLPLEPHAARVAPRHTVTPIAAARVRRLLRPDTWLVEMFMLKPFRNRRRRR
jgi:hypothetical protein